MEPETEPISEISLQPGSAAGSSSENSNIDTGSTGSISIEEASKNSVVWIHFIKDANFVNNKKATCKYCKKIYTCSQGSTTNLHKHLKNNHPAKLRHSGSNENINIMDIFTNTKVNIYLFFINFISITSINLYIIYI